jgi:hypothetical protein
MTRLKLKLKLAAARLFISDNGVIIYQFHCLIFSPYKLKNTVCDFVWGVGGAKRGGD